MEAILVTGGAGYIGSHVCKLLSQSGYLPVTIDSLLTGHRDAVKWGPLIRADLRDASAIEHAIAEYGVVAAMHFAALSQVSESIRDPARYYDNNMSAALSFISTLLRSGVRQFVFSSTAAVYGRTDVRIISEDHHTAPINPYGATKLAFEQVLLWLAKSSGLNSTILRYFNASGADADGEIGESHYPETHLIPLICQAALRQRPAITVFGSDYDTSDGTAVRDFIHVQDLASAHVAALRYMLAGGRGEIFNVGTGKGVTVTQIIRQARDILEREIPHAIGPRREGDPAELVADPGKILRTLHWRPCHSDLATIIRSTAHWQLNRQY